MDGQTTRPLNEDTLESFRGRVEIPAYDRRRLRPSIVHLAVGSFHRAHQAVYLDDLAARGSDWGERGVGLLPQDRAMAEALEPQQGLYTLLVRGAETDTARVIGSLLDYVFAPEQTEQAIAALADPGTQLVTMTITEAGYNVKEATGEFDPTNEAIQADLRNPQRPTTVFGYLAEALNRRRQAGVGPFTLLSCDNIQGNGDITKHAVVAFARLRDDALARWIEEQVAFPNSMVDRITPQTTDAERELVARDFGIADRWPVVTEPFRQWVVQDEFCNGRPALEEAGAQMVSDVHPFETMKLRLLNASHSAMGYLGYVAGYRTADAVMADPLFRELVERQMREEVAPLLPPVPDTDLDAYQRTLIERFSNPKIGDQLARICLDGSSKVPKFLLPALHAAVKTDAPHRCLTLALAGWLRYLTGVDDNGERFELQDARAPVLQPIAVGAREDPRPLLSRRDLFGDLIEHESFVSELASNLLDIYAHGVRATLAAALSISAA
jgi:fructuronate reductase/mannitol 2-dehydrogenase